MQTKTPYLKNFTRTMTSSLPRLLTSYLMLSWFFALCSQIIIPMPFNLVPLSLQPLPLILCAFILGWHGVGAYALYLTQGALGLPFFSGLQGGLARLCGPTGGYLMGFGLAMAFIALTRNYKSQSLIITGLKLLLAAIIYFSCGLAQLALFIPSSKLLAAGLLPFLVGDGLKIVCVLIVLKGLISSRKR